MKAKLNLLKNLRLAEAMIKDRAAQEFQVETARTQVALSDGTFSPTVRICGLLGDAVLPSLDECDALALRRAVLAACLAVRGYAVIVTTKAVAVGADENDDRDALKRAIKSGKRIDKSVDGVVVYGCAYWGIKAELVALGRPHIDVTENVTDNSDCYGWLNGFWDAVNEEIATTDEETKAIIDELASDPSLSPKAKGEVMH